VHRLGILGPARPEADLSLARARVLLARYGIVTRETPVDEPGPWTWDALYDQLGRMELRGEVRRGYFVTGLPGVQFVLPEAVEALRAARNRITEESSLDDALIVLSAVDPACLYGAEGLDAAPAFARLPSTHVVMWRGRPILVAEDSGARWTAAADASPGALDRALLAYLARPNAPRRLTVSTWNGIPVLDSPGGPIFQAHGFSRIPTGLERWA
jgi:ATP-dependent Lhr-like helicase